jgi:hypothetical protein
MLQLVSEVGMKIVLTLQLTANQLNKLDNTSETHAYQRDMIKNIQNKISAGQE